MEEKVFWELLGAACRMGRFVAAVPNGAASANIVGKLEIGRDGGETVLQRRKRPSAHVHFRPEAITEFAFIFVDPGSGAQPCLELRTREGTPALRLYYQGKKSARRFEEFAERTREHAGVVSGTWLAPAEAENEGIFVSDGGERAGEHESADSSSDSTRAEDDAHSTGAESVETKSAQNAGDDGDGVEDAAAEGRDARAADAVEVVNAS